MALGGHELFMKESRAFSIESIPQQRLGEDVPQGFVNAPFFGDKDQAQNKAGAAISNWRANSNSGLVELYEAMKCDDPAVLENDALDPKGLQEVPLKWGAKLQEVNKVLLAFYQVALNSSNTARRAHSRLLLKALPDGEVVSLLPKAHAVACFVADCLRHGQVAHRRPVPAPVPRHGRLVR